MSSAGGGGFYTSLYITLCGETLADRTLQPPLSFRGNAEKSSSTILYLTPYRIRRLRVLFRKLQHHGVTVLISFVISEFTKRRVENIQKCPPLAEVPERRRWILHFSLHHPPAENPSPIVHANHLCHFAATRRNSRQPYYI